MSETCPVCGGPVIHHSSEEGTQFYESRSTALLEALRDVAKFQPHPEVCIDEFAYNRLLDALRDHARESLAAFEGEQ